MSNQAISESGAKYVASLCSCIPGLDPQRIETAVHPLISGILLVVENVIPLIYLVSLVV